MAADALTTLTPAAAEEAVRWLAGSGPGEGWAVGRWLFLRALGLTHLIAFASLWVQLDGLIGSRGILPVQQYLNRVRESAGGGSLARVPTLFWLNPADRALHAACAAGVAFSALLVLNVAPALSLAALWLLYLSFAAVGQVFLSYQWDVLLLEASFLGVFLAPWSLFPAFPPRGPVPAIAVLLFWWLLFRLVFQSGVGKLRSGDPTWRNLTALEYHYFTQPLPSWTAWYVHQLPAWFHRASVVAVHALEVGWPFLFFGPREVRVVGFGGLVLLQLLIAGTGNYNFFNFLTVAIGFLLLDDAAWGWLLPGAWVPAGPGSAGTVGPLRLGLTVAAAVPTLAISGARLWRSVFPEGRLPGPLPRLIRWSRPLRTVNSYGLFRVMTTRRPEIIVQGSRDGNEWRSYRFRWKPGDPSRRPPFVQPHQPRLDWQMWFAALSNFQQTPWFHAFLRRLLEGSEPVEDLLAENPFPEDPPRFVRGVLYDYGFTTAEERARTGRWWNRERTGLYAPPVSLSGQPAGREPYQL